jgi:hypothetical protein
MLAPSALQRIYHEELANLAVMAKSRSVMATMEC